MTTVAIESSSTRASAHPRNRASPLPVTPRAASPDAPPPAGSTQVNNNDTAAAPTAGGGGAGTTKRGSKGAAAAGGGGGAGAGGGGGGGRKSTAAAAAGAADTSRQSKPQHQQQHPSSSTATAAAGAAPTSRKGGNQQPTSGAAASGRKAAAGTAAAPSSPRNNIGNDPVASSLPKKRSARGSSSAAAAGTTAAAAAGGSAPAAAARRRGGGGGGGAARNTTSAAGGGEPRKPVIRKIAAVPMSPRTATRKLANPEAVSYREIRETTTNVAKTVNRIMQLAYEVGRNGEVTTPDGNRYTRSDVTELASRTVQAICGIPKAVKRSSRRNHPQLSTDEKNARIRALVVKAEAGMEALNVFLKNKAATKLLLENEVARIRTIRTPPKADAGDQISAAFFISDPLQKFFENANLGNGIALFYPGLCSDATKAISGAANAAAAIEAVARETGRNVIADLGGKRDVVEQLADPRRVIAPLVIERSIATAPLLMALMALYILANNLKTPEGRIRIDSNMQKFFGPGTNTRWVVGEKDLTEQARNSPDLGKDEAAALNSECELSGIERLSARAPKNPSDPSPCDGSTFTRAMSIALASYYRVRWVTPEMKADLAKDSVKNLAYGVKAYL